MDDARAHADGFRLALYGRYPALRMQRSDVPPVDAADLAALLGDGRTALVEFVVGRESTVAFVVTRAPNAAEGIALTVHRIDRSAEALEHLVDDYF